VKKLLVILVSLILLTIVFLVIVLVLNRDSGKGAMQVTSSPSKSKVYLDGDYIGDTPLCKCELPQMLPIGDYSIKIVPQEPGLSSFEQRVKVNSGVLTAVDRTFGDSATGSIITLSPISDKKAVELMIISFPNDSSVFMDNRDIGKAPLVLKNITDSDHEIKLSKNSFQDKVLKIRTVMGFRLEAQVFMAAGKATPSPTSSPSAQQSQTKIQILQTPTGFLRVRAEANATSSAEVGRVKPGEEYDLVSEKDAWYQIKLSTGKLGWVSSDYASKN